MKVFKVPSFVVDMKALFSKKVGLFVAELGGCALVLTAIAHFSVPAALAAGGLGLIVAIERQ